MKVILAIGAVIVVAGLIAATYLPITTHEGLRVCLHCGLNRQDKIVVGFRRSTFAATQFSQWYDRRIGLAHEHQWEEDESGAVLGENLWGRKWTIAQFECGRRGIAHDYENLGTRLHLMEALDLDLDFWKEITHRDETRAAEARFVAGRLGAGPDAQVRYEWSLMKQYLEDRAAWGGGFAVYWGSVVETSGVTPSAPSSP